MAVVEKSIAGCVPKHVGIILDGNRRWAKERGLPAWEGHSVGLGFDKISSVLAWCAHARIETVTLWMLSTDNIAHRSPEELAKLWGIESDTVQRLRQARPCRLRHIGFKELLPDFLADNLQAAEHDTRTVDGITANLAIGYGGRDDILHAVRNLYADILHSGDASITASRFARHLSTAGQPDVDLVIRTSGESRVSGFMPWEAALAELHFCEKKWPEFEEGDLREAIACFQRRHRRLGS